MKANYFLGNGRFELREIPVPEPGDTDVLIRVAACGVCGTDVHIFHGDKGSAEVVPPVVLGHELAGVVARTGKAVTLFREGDHVSVDPNIYCGKCRPCRTGRKQLCENLSAVGVTRDGGFAEYCLVPEAQCFAVGKDVPLVYAAMTEPLACCIHGIERAGIRPGSNVLVIGGGAIGLMMVQLAKLSGASKVLLSEPIAFRRETGMRVGADAAVDPVNGDLPESMRETFGGEGADVIIECVGIPAVSRQALEVASRGSTVLLFSVPQVGASVPLSLDDVYRKELTVMGSMINPDTHGKAAALISSGRIDLQPLITHTYPLSKLYDAVIMQQGNESLKVIVEPQRGE